MQNTLNSTGEILSQPGNPGNISTEVPSASDDAMRLAQSIDFTDGDLNGNFQKLMDLFGFVDESEIGNLISRYSIDTNLAYPDPVDVKQGKYKSALFIYWLSGNSDLLIMDDEKRKLVWSYFGAEICDDALNNSHTQHTTVGDILAPRASVVLLKVNKDGAKTHEDQ